ncbi:universal stress protein [Phaeacidiphilus oryzae]|uniref:universal stress protein n=1 Tax=Phaeacidiphilus oryzae TaxID=348818 RepID=UPI00055F48B8|nr:universal stress protein [Phaeacidiphilus oryzae]
MVLPVVACPDGTPSDAVTARWAAREALLRRAPLVLLGVAPAGSTSGREDGLPARLRLLATDLPRSFPGVSVTVRTAAGPPGPVLVAASAETDLLVLAAGPPEQPAGAAPGAVTAAAATVAARAHCPVALLRVHLPQGVVPPFDIVLGSVDGRIDAVTAEFAFRLADERGARLAVESPGTAGSDGAGPANGDEDDLDGLDGLLNGMQEKFPSVRVARRPGTGDPEEQLLRAAQQASVLVLGVERGRRGAAAPAAPGLQRILDLAPGPVALVPHDA